MLETAEIHHGGLRAVVCVGILVMFACGQGTDDGTDNGTDDGTDTRETGDIGPDVMACNGRPSLCDRRFDEVAYVTTHNAMANEGDGFLAPNHLKSMKAQLEDGVRGMMLDTHYFEEGTYLCHTYCEFGKMPLREGLEGIRDFLLENPHEVVALLFEAYVSEHDAAVAFEEAGLMDMVHMQTAGLPWPTLREMISIGHRVVAFSDDLDHDVALYNDIWEHCWETGWNNKEMEDFNCERGRGSEDSTLFILNHFLTDPIALPALAEEANANPQFELRAFTCMEESGAIPNFVTVDFYSIGDVFDVVDKLNGVGR